MGDIGYGVPSEPAASTALLGRQRCPKCRALAIVQNVVPIREGFEYLTLTHLYGANTPRAWPNFGDNHADGEAQRVNDPWRV
jgi:hypothetical protein